MRQNETHDNPECIDNECSSDTQSRLQVEKNYLDWFTSVFCSSLNRLQLAQNVCGRENSGLETHTSEAAQTI